MKWHPSEWRAVSATPYPAAAPHLRDEGAVCWIQPRQHLRRDDLGQTLEQSHEQRRRVGYQPLRPQPAQQLVLGKLGPLGSP